MVNSDCQKILELLKQRGEKGLHSFEIVRLVATIRGAARIYDLKKQGHKITSIPEKLGDAIGTRYFLNSTAPVPSKDAYIDVFDNETYTYRRVKRSDLEPKQMELI